ncbi:hypothetical protein K450DRAFT_241738 [Umbelopsis ramanniana AG]|uniref:Sodium/calcium exchanger membrane region domain-containing protein n=1 Tax=Umbelopsis ramanniana AG TaxID=1314678 RepID=A0AAD5E934_UMBRA|nr:uncharacterized protein K450DRAFT_241738 [Umbelopsis ramanniana AG]KAI8579591.1 hypothetical protein K450DRAFT_241738 [Umbelopsis ramanniana AG]
MLLSPRVILLILLISYVHAYQAPFDSDTPIPCEHIYNHPDQCSFVKQNCQEYSTGIVDYLTLYYCSGPYKPLILIALFSFLAYLFAAIGVVASDFFCPNLQTIASSLHLSESLAGVTFLAFGNASPDLFTTFSALNSGSGSLAVGELVGAAFFIVTVVAGGMAIIQPFRAKRVVILRDVTFFTGAVAIVGWIVYDQKIYLYEAVGLILYYALYVVVVVGSIWWKNRRRPKVVIQPADEAPVSPLVATENTPLISKDSIIPTTVQIRKAPKVVVFEPPHDQEDVDDSEEEEAREHVGHLGHIIRPVSPKMMRRISLRIDTNNLPTSDGLHAPVSSKSYRPPLTPRVGIRPSIFGAIEFRNALNAAQHANMQLKNDLLESRHRRNQSMPSYMFPVRSATSPSDLESQTSQSSAQKRANKHKRPSDLADMVISSQEHNLSPSSEESIGVAEDYFGSANRLTSHHQKSSPPTQFTSHSNHLIDSPTYGLTPPHRTEDGNLLHASPPHSPSLGLQISTDNLAPGYSARPPATSRSASAMSTRSSPSIRSVMSEITAQEERSSFLANTKCAKKIIFCWRSFEKRHQGFCEILSEVWRTLFPTMQNWNTKSITNIASSILAIPIVFLLEITLPVVEDDTLRVDDMVISVKTDDDQSSDTLGVDANEFMEDVNELDDPFEETVDQKWLKWQVVLQSICAPTFVSLSLYINDVVALNDIMYGVMVGVCLALTVNASTKSHSAPPWINSLAFAGFVVSLNWIYTVANEVVGLLQALGLILDISGAILGLTVFAMGNSLGDLVANISMAKMGLPNMAISACYAGPLLNLVLGLGCAATYRVWVTGETYELELAPTIIISSIGLLLVLMTAIVVTYFNHYRIDKWIGMMWIGIYIITTSFSIFMEVQKE